MGKAVQRLEREKDVLKGLESDMEEIIGKVNQKAGSGVTVQTLKEYSAYISFLKEKIEFQKENVNSAKKNVDNYREQLVKADQEKEMLLKLKEKKHEEYMKEQLRLEQKLNDEVVSYKYSKRTENEV
jgi:flagellar FliJ protein